MTKISALAAILVLVVAPAWADHAAPLADPVVKAACGECHMAFQPAFLPARSWDKIMADLANHFGDNAAMAPDKAAHVRAVLARGAADTGGGRMGAKVMKRLDGSAAPLRITETPWFIRKHDLPARAWARPDVVSKSNCPACHRGAEAGDYEDP